MKKRGKKGVTAALVVLCVFAGTGVLHLFGVFDYLESKSYDVRVNVFASASRPSDDIVVLLLDQGSLDWAAAERGWAWPWPRKAYADILDYMNLGGAKSVAFDVLFSEPSIYRSANQDEIIDNAVNKMEAFRANSASSAEGYREVTEALRTLAARSDDESFIAAEKNYGKTVQSVFFSSQSGSVETWPAGLDKPLFTPVDFGPFLDNFKVAQDGRVGAQFPIPGLSGAAGALGNVTSVSLTDGDGIIRRSRLFTLFDGKAVPGLSAASLLVSGGDTEIRYNEKKRQMEWGDFVIPVDAEGRTLLRFRGGIDRYIPYYAADILKSAEAFAAAEEPLLPPENFTGRHVFFGFYAPGLFDICSTPIESVYPGIGIHITMLDNLLGGDFIQEIPRPADWMLLAAVVFLVTVLSLFAGKLPFSVGGTLVIIGGIVAAAFACYNAGFWLPMVMPLAGVLAAFVTCTVYNYVTEGSQKRYIKSAFSQYLSPAVIEQIIADPSNLELGGKSLEMSAIFTDIQRFSSISEGLQKAYGKEGPKELVNLLNLYLTEMSNIVLANQGTIDKFEGDAIIAFFGAPVPTDRHAALACRSAIQMKKAEAAMTRRIMEPAGRFYPVLQELITKKAVRPERPLYTRVGINSGEMVVGNMGTPSKMNYTIMGNAVNLAARLEGVNKQYDTGGILMSEYTREKTGDEEFVLRPLSRVRVVGISTPVRLYELLDLRESASRELCEMVQKWETIFAAYENKDFEAAFSGFKAFCLRDSNDLTARLYMTRCEQYLKAPSSDEVWDDGVDNLTSK